MKSSTLWRHLSSNMRRVSLLIIPGLYGDVTNTFFSEQTSCKICSISVKMFTYNMLCLVVCLLLRTDYYVQMVYAVRAGKRKLFIHKNGRSDSAAQICWYHLRLPCWNTMIYTWFHALQQQWVVSSECQLLGRRVLHGVSLHSRFDVHCTWVSSLDELATT